MCMFKVWKELAAYDHHLIILRVLARTAYVKATWETKVEGS